MTMKKNTVFPVQNALFAEEYRYTFLARYGH
jgi:hypothetical protein